MDVINAPWFGAGLGLLGICFAIYQIFKARGPQLSSQFIGQNLIRGQSTDLPGGISITFEGQQLTNLSLSQVVIWNSGAASVRRTDLVAADALALSFGDDAQIFRVDVIKTTRPAIGFSATIDAQQPTILLLDFEFLDPQDGALLKIWHTGAETRPHFRGTVVGLPQGVNNLGRMPPRFSKRAVRERMASDPLEHVAIRMAAMLYGKPLAAPTGATILGLVGFAILLGAPLFGDPVPQGAWWPLFVTAALYLATGLAGIWMLRRKYPASIGPDELAADAGAAGRPSASVQLTPAQRAQIRQYKAEHPDAHQRDIAAVFEVNPGRVSEALGEDN